MTDALDAEAAYARGADPIEYASRLLEAHLRFAANVAELRETDPNAIPAYGAYPTNQTLSYRLVAALLDADWTPPAANRGAA